LELLLCVAVLLGLMPHSQRYKLATFFSLLSTEPLELVT
jgi:hypothetical protein